MTATDPQPDVMVVEDDPVVLDELVVSLRRAGLACVAAHDAWEALEQIQRGIRPTVMVCDIRMPELDGLELVQRLSRLEATERPEVIFVSGHAGFDEAVAAMRLGARDLLTKPIDLRRLIQIIKEIRLEPAAPTAVPTPPPAEPDDAPALPPEEMPLKVLRDLRRLRRLRIQHLPAGLVPEASWEILLDLYSCESKGIKISVTSLAVATGAPMTSALRRIQELESSGFIDRLPDGFDRRRATLRLTPQGRTAVETFARAYLARDTA
ncbi:MAG: DNA-binding response regulator [Proteobacteria bacterium]|nr:DNA-binding response regulator [Pseudomonadota bacterium]